MEQQQQADGNGTFQVPPEVARHAAWHRLEDQLDYYERRSGRYRKRYLAAKVAQIVLGAGIPLLAAVPVLDSASYKFLSAAFGATVAALEGLLQLFQWHALWLQYRGAAEQLKRERWLLLSGAQAYAGVPVDAALVMLAARVEALLAPEHENWAGLATQAAAQGPAADAHPQPAS